MSPAPCRTGRGDLGGQGRMLGQRHLSRNGIKVCRAVPCRAVPCRAEPAWPGELPAPARGEALIPGWARGNCPSAGCSRGAAGMQHGGAAPLSPCSSSALLPWHPTAHPLCSHGTLPLVPSAPMAPHSLSPLLPWHPAPRPLCSRVTLPLVPSAPMGPHSSSPVLPWDPTAHPLCSRITPQLVPCAPMAPHSSSPLLPWDPTACPL